MFGERNMSKSSVGARFASALSLLVLFMSAACVSASFAAGRIRVGGIDPSSAYASSSVRVYGSGATPEALVVALLGVPGNEFIVYNETSPWIVRLPLEGSGLGNLTLGSCFAGESGDWEISFLTPNVLPGDYSVYVFDNGSLTSDVVSFRVLINVTVIVAPWSNVTYFSSNVTIGSLPLNVSLPLLFVVGSRVVPSSGVPGTLVTVSGSSASGGEVDVYFDDVRVVTVVGERGAWSASFPVPVVAPGNHTIRAVDVGGRWISVASFYVTSSVMSLFVPLSYLFGLFALAVFSGVTVFLFFAAFLRRRRRCDG